MVFFVKKWLPPGFTSVMQAYDGLEEGPSGSHLAKVSANGTAVSFISEQFLTSNYCGILECRLLRAENLRAVNLIPGTNSDPYCIFSMDGGMYRSETAWNNLNPVWDETFHLYVKDKSSSRLKVRLLDDNLVAADSLISSFVLSISDLTEDQAQEFGKSLGNKGEEGNIRFSLKFFPFRDDIQLQNYAVGAVGGPVLGSPPETLMKSKWREKYRELLASAEAVAEIEFDPIAFVDNKESDTQCWLFWNEAKQKLVIAFRGTEQTQWKDMATDAQLAQTTIEHDEGELRTCSETSADDEKIWVHSGFLNAYLSVKNEVVELVNQVCRQANWTIYVTGHSLGGALATCCAYDLAMRNKQGRAMWSDIECYTFGSPMVGGKAFIESFDAIIPNCWRVVNENDAVSLVPRMMGYAHVGKKVLLCKDGTVEYSGGKGQDVGENLTWTDFVVKLGSQALASTQGTSSDDSEDDFNVDDVLTSEMQAMQQLIEGVGISDHMEPAYMASMTSAILASVARNSRPT